MPNKRISALPVNTTPTLSDVVPSTSSGITKKLTLAKLTDFISNKISLTGGTFNSLDGVLTLRNITGSTLSVSGFTLSNTITKHWIKDNDKIMTAQETLVISGNFVLENSNLVLTNSQNIITIGNVDFTECSNIFIGGSLLLIDSNIINNGKISVAGGVILTGSSTITGSGTLN